MPLSVGVTLLLAWSTLVGAGAAAPSEDRPAQGGGAVVLVLDGSGSMKEPGGAGATRMTEAKAGLRAVVEDLPDDAQVGLRVYGSTISEGPGSCEDTELLAPVARTDRGALRAGVDRLRPLGNTPIAYSLRQAYGDLPTEGPRSIVLVSDGEENCGGDPCEVAADLRKKGADFYVDVVGLQVDPASRAQLTCIASAGGGTYYDVQDVSRLQDTLTRTSVRAARGYAPAGRPVEGGTTRKDAPAVTDGQWLDTVGDSGPEHYRLPDPGRGTFHVAAATLPTRGFTGVSSVEVGVVSADGTPCGSPARETAQGASNGGAPIAAALTLSATDREDCGGGPYVATVTSNNEEVQGLELLVRTEPEVEDASALPAAFGRASGFSDEVQTGRAAADAVPVVGGPNFSSAPPTPPGTYEDTVLPGETLFYRLPDVGWGRSAVCDATLGTSDRAARAFGRAVGVTAQVRVYGAMKTLADDSSARTARAQWRGDRALDLHAASPPVVLRNRESSSDTVRAFQLAGDAWCSVTVLPTSAATAEEVGEVPLTLTTSVAGEEAGVPAYVEPEPRAEAATDDAGPASWLLAVAGLVVVALVGGSVVMLRRRRAP
ncbi:hypothetical protein AERYTH_05785 [Aeromicrobium erythreum]|jgi:Ca-activated chloride channel family protein|uniref:VWFA domain-containing protein n=2 Tax=Aeromicrobium erythreum TaxID=2041 RepID=A0A0U4B8T1_9ACTN|nr:hypothetical protein AERYTH_05785 [Aeromicrobium erythreum]